MTLFLASLIGIPPLGGWYAKFGVFKVLVGADTGLAIALAIIMAVNTAIAAFYYLRVARAMWFEPVPDGDDTTPVRGPVVAHRGHRAVDRGDPAVRCPARPAERRHVLRSARPRALTPAGP